MDEQERTVVRILEELGAGDRPVIKVYNKLDLYQGPALHDGISISALNGTNLDKLKQAIISVLLALDNDVVY